MKNQTEMYHEAQTHMEGNEDQAAITTLETLLNQYPEESQAHMELGALHHKKGNFQIALDHYQKASAMDATNTQILKILADFHYVEMQDVPSAMDIYKGIIAIEPNDVDSLTIIANLCLCEHLWEEAEKYYRRVQDLEPWRFEIQEIMDKLASRHEGVGREEEPDVMALYQSSQERVEAGDPTGAIEYLEQILTKDPDHALAHNDLGVLHYQMGNKENALAHYRLAVQKMPDNHVFLKNMADFYCFEQGNLQEALPVYSKILNEEPTDVEVLMTIGWVNIQLDRLSDARVFFNRVLDVEPWNVEAGEQLDRLQSEDLIRH